MLGPKKFGSKQILGPNKIVGPKYDVLSNRIIFFSYFWNPSFNSKRRKKIKKLKNFKSVKEFV